MKLFLSTAAILILLPSSITGSLFPFEPEDSSSDFCNENNLTLSFSESPLHKIGKGFISSPILTCIDISNSGIRSIDKGAFDYVPNLRFLNLQGNDLSADNLFSFGGHMNLRQLVLSNQRTYGECYYSSFTKILGMYPELRYLDLKESNICGLVSDLEDSMPRLTDLDLSNNKISTVNLTFAKSLRNVYLHGNEIVRCSLRSLHNLTTITLDDNKFTNVEWLASSMEPSQYRNLRSLSLSNNRIASIDDIAFTDMINLKYLNLSSNALDAITYRVFDFLLSLEILLLDNNLLESIPPINKNLSVSILSMKCNRLRNLRGCDFRCLPNLQKLVLSGNMISDMSMHVFENQKLLEELYLDSNQLSYLPHGWHQSLTSLRYLDLSRNKFTSLVPLFYSKNFPLLQLYFGLNPLRSINASISGSLPKNVTIYLEIDYSRPNLTCEHTN